MTRRAEADKWLGELRVIADRQRNIGIAWGLMLAGSIVAELHAAGLKIVRAE